jgi:sulfur carrier protein ThiS
MGSKSKNAKPKQGKKNGVTLTVIRQGIGRQDYALPEGATLADLLREAQTETEHEIIQIDGKSLEEHLVLKTGMIVTIVPMPGNAAADERWRETIGMFHGNESFRELVEAVEASREAEKERS